MKIMVCELCNADAAVYCSSDSAFLCWTCDSKVHHANFLVARHVRRSICFECNGIIGESIPGIGFQKICRCSPAVAAGSDLVTLSSSVCVSSTTTRRKEYSGRREPCVFNSSSGNDSSGEVKSENTTRIQRGMVDSKLKAIFVNWCAHLGLSGDVAVQMANDALKICLEQLTVLPFRVCLAASMWFGLRVSGASTRQSMKRLEEMSGLSAKLIAAAESKLEKRLLKVRRQKHRREHQLVEGWGEC